MKNKLMYLTGVSLKRKIYTKSFLIANILIAIVIMVGFNIDTIINMFGGDFNEKTVILLKDETKESADIFSSSLVNASNTFSLTDKDESVKTANFEIKKTNEDIKDLKKRVDDEKKTIAVILSPDENNVMNATLITKDYLSAIEVQTITTTINATKSSLATSKSNITPEVLAKISSPATINRIFLNEDKDEAGEMSESVMGVIFIVIILPFFMLTLFLVQMIGAEINDEKTTRGMEIIISNVSPQAHFFSKVLAGNIFVLMQGALLFAYAGIGLLIRTLISNKTGFISSEIVDNVINLINNGIGDKLIYIIPLTLVLMIATFIAYSLLAGVLASMTTNIEDFQQLQTPIMIISLAGYYLSAASSMFSGSLFIRIFSYIPFISAVLAPSLLLVGEIGIVDVLISILLVIGVNFLLIKYGLKVYKAGILNYSSKGLWKKMFKALKDS